MIVRAGGARLQHVRLLDKIITAPQWLEDFGWDVTRADAAYFAQCNAAAHTPLGTCIGK